MEEVWLQHNFQTGLPRALLSEVPAIMLNIINKIIVQDIGAKSEMNTRKYKPMMALDDEVEAN